MKLLILPSWYPSEMDPNGVPFIRAQAQALVRAGHQVMVVFTQPYSLKTVLKKKKLMFGVRQKQVEGVFEIQSYFPKTHLKRIDQFTRLIMGKRRLKQMVKQQGLPQIIHAHTYQVGPLALWFHKKYKVPLITTEHYTGFARNMVKPWELKMAQNLYRNSALNLAVSPVFAARLQKITGVPFSVIGNMVNTELFTLPSPSSVPIKQTFTYLFVGSLHEKKNPVMLLESFISAYKKENTLRLIFVGEGELKAALSRQVIRENLESVVSFKGFLEAPDIAQIMKQSDCLVLPSRFETFGIVVIEAMSSGLPVIVTRSGGPESFVLPGENGLVIDQDPEQLKEAMEQVRKINKKKEAIRQFVLDRYSEKAVCAQLNALYEKQLSKPHIIQSVRDLTLSGGISKVAWYTARELTRLGYQVTTYTSQIDPELPDHDMGRVISIELPPFIRKIPSYLGKFLQTWLFTVKTSPYLRQGRKDPHCVTISQRDSFGADLAVGHSCHREAVEIKRKEGSRFWFLNPLHPLYLTQERHIFRKPYPYLAAISRAIGGEFQKHYQLPESFIRIIPNGVDTDLFTNENRQKAKEKIHKELNLPPEGELLLFVGNEFKRKGLEFIIKALPLLNHKETYLAVLGGADKTDFEALAKTMGVSERVSFLGVVSDTAPWFAAARLFVLPVNYEPFGLVGIEALSSGTPVLAAAVGGFLDYLQDGINGFFIERNENDIAKKINQLHMDTDLYEKLSYNARKTATEYSWNKIGKLYEELIGEIYEKKHI